MPKQVEAFKEFQEVRVATNLIIQGLRLNLKGKITDALKIDILIVSTELYSNHVEELYSIVQRKLLSEKTTCAHVILSSILHYHEEALLETFDTNKEELCQFY